MIKVLPLKLGYTASSKKLTEALPCHIGEMASLTNLYHPHTSYWAEASAPGKDPIIDLEIHIQKECSDFFQERPTRTGKYMLN